MPEPYWPKRKNSFTLLDAHKIGHIIRVFCRYCKRERFFLANELATAYGNIECDDLAYAIECSKCGNQVDVSADSPSAEQRQKMTIRRLVTVYYVRHAKWRDEPPKM
jgi:hypothetical protein